MGSSLSFTVDNTEEPPVAVIHLVDGGDFITLRHSVKHLRAMGYQLFAIDTGGHRKVAESVPAGTSRQRTTKPSLRYWVATAGVTQKVLRRFQLILRLSGPQLTMISCPTLQIALKALRSIGSDDYPRV